MSLRLISLTRRFGDQLALDGVSVHVRKGDCYGFIGHNGAGKTTAMRVALGLARADKGRVLVDGFDAAEHPTEARARMGGLIEVPGFHGTLDGAGNLGLLARLGGMSRGAARSEAQRLLEKRRSALAAIDEKRRRHAVLHGLDAWRDRVEELVSVTVAYQSAARELLSALTELARAGQRVER